MMNESIIETIGAMRRQENNIQYQPRDYLHTDSATVVALPTQPNVDENCRYQMSVWFYQICDFCKFEREAVAIAMSYLDRFLSTPGGNQSLSNRSTFKLACIACLYTAIKIHCKEALDPSHIMRLSKGEFDREQLENMERMILESLEWRMNPPTASQFLHLFLYLIPTSFTNCIEESTVIDLAKLQIELAVHDYGFVGVQASLIALAALANSLECTGMSVHEQSPIIHTLADVTKLDLESRLFHDVQTRLYECIVNDHGHIPIENTPQQETIVDQMPKNYSSGQFLVKSPRSVVVPGSKR